MIYIHYWLLFSKNPNFQFATIYQKRSFNSFSLFHIFLPHLFLFYYLFSNPHAQKTIRSIIYIAYRTLWMSEICIGGRFLEDYFSCYSQQLLSVVANESLIPYYFIKRSAETQNLWYCNSECQSKTNKNNVKYSLVFRTKDFLHTNRNNKNTCKWFVKYNA